MTQAELQEATKHTAKVISAQMVAFVDQGFTRAEAHALCCAMLSSAVVFSPFAGISSPTETRH